jgi:hypothetical protein
MSQRIIQASLEGALELKSTSGDYKFDGPHFIAPLQALTIPRRYTPTRVYDFRLLQRAPYNYPLTLPATALDPSAYSSSDAAIYRSRL